MTSSGSREAERPRCPLCGGLGHVIENGRARACECLRPVLASLSLRAAHIPAAYGHATLDSFIADSHDTELVLKRIREQLENYGSNARRGWWLIGPNGVGKTHLAVAILRTLIERGHTGAFYNVINLLDSFKAEFGQREGGPDIMHTDLSREVLVLDDLGVQRATGWSADRLHAVINRRYEMGLTLIITTNKTPKQLMQVLDAPVISRLYEMCTAISIEGKDRRLGLARGQRNPRDTQSS